MAARLLATDSSGMKQRQECPNLEIKNSTGQRHSVLRKFGLTGSAPDMKFSFARDPAICVECREKASLAERQSLKLLVAYHALPSSPDPNDKHF